MLNRLVPLKAWATFGYSPNEWALENIHKHPARFQTGVTCRQAGKTLTAGIEIHSAMTEELPEEKPPSVGVLAPTYDKAELLVRQYEDRILKAFGRDYYTRNANKHEIKLHHNGAILKWLSATDPDSVIGYTFTTLFTDESQNIPDIVWNKVFPTLAVNRARVVSFGTPDITPEQSWFKANFIRGEDDGYPDHHSFKVTCFENPWMSLDEIRIARDSMTEAEFRMLFLAEWPMGESQVFRGWRASLLPTAVEYDAARRHVMSVDFGIKDDFTVVMLGETATRSVIEMHRLNAVGSLQVYDQVEELWIRWGRPLVNCDATGIGLPMIEELERRGMRIARTVIGPTNKMQMVGRLAADMEHRRIQFPEWEELRRELDAYVYESTPSGRLTANAAAGFHDDCVWALILLNESFHRRRGRTSPEPENYLVNNNMIRDPLLIGAFRG